MPQDSVPNVNIEQNLSQVKIYSLYLYSNSVGSKILSPQAPLIQIGNAWFCGQTQTINPAFPPKTSILQYRDGN